MVAHGGFQAGEREVERLPVEQGPGQRVGVRVAELGEPRQCRAAGIAEAKKLGRLVERLAGSIVDGVAEQLVAADVGHLEQLRVAARDEQRDEGKRRRISGEKRRQEMTFQVMDTYGRSVQRRGDRTSHAGADEQRTGKPRPAGVGDDVHLVERRPGLNEHLPQQRQHAADVVAGRQLRNDTAVGRVKVDLAVQGLPAQLGKVSSQRANDSSPGFVARSLDPDDVHRSESRSSTPVSLIAPDLGRYRIRHQPPPGPPA